MKWTHNPGNLLKYDSLFPYFAFYAFNMQMVETTQDEEIDIQRTETLSIYSKW